MTRWIVVTVVMVSGCSFPTLGDHGESFGPIVLNECDQPVIAVIADSVAAAELEIRESPITMQPGWRSQISYVVIDDFVPERLFLLVGVDADSAAMLEFETADVRHAAVDNVFEADCSTLVRV